jgi:hypothetical protein
MTRAKAIIQAYYGQGTVLVLYGVRAAASGGSKCGGTLPTMMALFWCAANFPTRMWPGETADGWRSG